MKKKMTLKRNDITKDYLLSFHPELKQINFNELLSLSKITRNKKGIIVDPLHKTFPYLTKFERAKILGQRAKKLIMVRQYLLR